MIAPVILAVVSFIAGHPTTVACDATLDGHAIPNATGWTYTGGSTVYVVPEICEETNAPIGTFKFADGLATMIHEAARAHGWQSDSCVELLADVGVFDILRKFYGVDFFTPMSGRVGAQVLILTRQRPASYQPEACWNSGVMK